MKQSDPIIDEVRAIRDSIAKECNYDVEQLSKLLKSHEVQSNRKVVRRPPKPVSDVRKAS
jgi:hypothetical protein